MTDTTPERAKPVNGPTTHLIVEQERLGKVLRKAKSSVEGTYLGLADAIQDRMEVVAAEAYREGLRDGFAQGCIAESQSGADA